MHHVLMSQDPVLFFNFSIVVYVMSVVATSVYIVPTSDRESDIYSGIHDLVSVAHPINDSKQENEQSIYGIFQ